MTSPDPKAQQAQQTVARRIQELEREFGDRVTPGGREGE